MRNFRVYTHVNVCDIFFFVFLNTRHISDCSMSGKAARAIDTGMPGLQIPLRESCPGYRYHSATFLEEPCLQCCTRSHKCVADVTEWHVFNSRAVGTFLQLTATHIPRRPTKQRRCTCSMHGSKERTARMPSIHMSKWTWIPMQIVVR